MKDKKTEWILLPFLARWAIILLISHLFGLVKHYNRVPSGAPFETHCIGITDWLTFTASVPPSHAPMNSFAFSPLLLSVEVLLTLGGAIAWSVVAHLCKRINESRPNNH